jgi:hypothetical protein
MSQAGIVSVAGGGGTTTYVEDVGFASASGGILQVLGGVGISTTGMGNIITISATSGAFQWNDITTPTQLLAVENGYVTDRAGGVTYTLPATASFGDEIFITGKQGLWTVSQNANQQIVVGAVGTTIGVGGSLTATSVGDSIQMVAITGGASTVWRVISEMGNPTIV